MEELHFIFPPAELALEIYNKMNISYLEIAVGESFIPKIEEAPISAKCSLIHAISKRPFGIESELISTNVNCKLRHQSVEFLKPG